LGLLTVILIVGTLQSAGLYFLGIENPVFFGMLAAVLAVIPYIGIMIGSILPALVALVTKDSAWYALGVIIIMQGIQFLESNFITPFIVGGSVSVNQIAALLALLVGGSLWGVIGMILAIPFTAIIKVIFDNVDGLKPWGFLLGDAPPLPKRIKKLES
jgi:predicted PurR-regulated permease PerM